MFGRGSRPRAGLAAASCDGKAYFGGGLGGPQGVSNVVDIFDSATNTWSTSSLSQARYDFAAASAGGIVLFGGGNTGSYSNGGPFSSVLDIGVVPEPTIAVYAAAGLALQRRRRKS